MKDPNSTTSSIKTTWLSLLALLFCCLLAYWALTFHIFSLKNDALNYFLPVRYQISEAISNGYWPFWSPYFNLGYPLHGDMQSGVWNPFVQIISLFGPYTLKTLQYETLLYVYLSGVGMFFLLKYFFKDWKICLLGATSFMLCGFNSDSAQFLNWISGASFLPFVFLFYYRTVVEKNWKTALCCGLFLFLLFTTSYPADFILTAYLLLFLLTLYFFKKDNRKKIAVWQETQLHFLIAISFLLLSLPAIISYAEYLPLTERGSGASYEEVMSNSLHPALLFSFLTPLPVWKASFAAITDPLERNCFMGLIPFTFLLLSFLIPSRQPLIRFMKWAFVLSILFSFGEAGGLRVVSYYILPLMNTFRHPANAKLFSIFLGCWLAVFAYKEEMVKKVRDLSKKIIWIILLICFTALSIWALAGHISVFTLPSGSIKSWLDSLSFSDLLIINILLQVPFLLILYYGFVKKTRIKTLLIASLLNCMVHTALFQPFTVVKKDKVTFIQNILDSVQHKGYPFPNLNTPLIENSKNGDQFFKEIGAANMYNKRIGRIDYRITPSNLLIQNEFWSNPKIRNLLFQYPLFYKADTALVLADTVLAEPRTNQAIAFVQDSQTQLFINQQKPSAFVGEIIKFTPNSWELHIESSQPHYYSIFQNYYPRWHLLVDGKPHPLHHCNISFMGFELPAGKHTVTFQYKAWDLKIAYSLSLVTLLIILILLFAKRATPSFLSSPYR
jgi:hypothetical protein